ncbi:hypothetical protein AGMMS49579_19180 [Spirochaetia bacterium]|nr:hypothetical protein AGMMS49579_19180 [Spirochaetia bacterium]
MKRNKFFVLGVLAMVLTFGLAVTGCDSDKHCDVDCTAKGTTLNNTRKTCKKSGCAVEKAQFSTYTPIDVSCDC